MKIPPFNQIRTQLYNTQNPPKETTPENTLRKPEQPQNPPADWNVLVYLAADTEPDTFNRTLEIPMLKNVIDMEKVGSNENMNIIAQIDRGKNPSDVSGGWAGCKRFHIQKDNDENNINSPVIKEFPTDKINMADPKTLTDFIVESASQFPAKHTFLILNNHGSGWLGALQDFSDFDGKFMSLPNVKKAIADAEKITGKKIDILGFDACVMGQAEVAYELKDNSDILIASQEIINGPGWPYSGILSEKMLKQIQLYMDQHKCINPEKFAQKVIEECRKKQVDDTYTMSAIKLENKIVELSNTFTAAQLGTLLPPALAPAIKNNKLFITSFYMHKLKEASNQLARAILEANTPTETLREIINKSQEFGGVSPYSDSKDIIDVAEKIIKSKKIKDKKLKEASKNLIKTLKDTILAEEHLESEYPGAHGLSIYLPVTKYRNEYLTTMWAKDTLWDEAFIKIGGKNLYIDTTKEIGIPKKSAKKSAA